MAHEYSANSVVKSHTESHVFAKDMNCEVETKRRERRGNPNELDLSQEWVDQSECFPSVFSSDEDEESKREPTTVCCATQTTDEGESAGWDFGLV